MNPQDRLHLPQDEERLLEYLDGQLAVPEARAVEAHLAVCVECQALRRQWEELEERVAGALAQPRLSADFAERLRQQIEAKEGAGAPGVRVRERPGAGSWCERPWIGERRRMSSELWLELLDVLGYGAVAAVAGFGLMHLAKAWDPGTAAGGVAFLRSPAFLLGVVVGGAALLFGLSLAARNTVLRWVRAF